MTVALAFVAMALLLVFIHHMGYSIQVSNMARRIADGTMTAARRPYPGSYGEPVEEDPDAVVARWQREEPPTLVYPAEAGFVQSIDDLAATIDGRSIRVELLVSPGDFVTPRQPLARVWTDGDRNACAAAVGRSIAVAPERDLEQDMGYGLRQLTDIR